MKTQLGRLLAVAILVTLGTGGAWAKDKSVKEVKGKGTIAAPEIDAASGTSAIALLTGVVLLAGERSRRSRSGKDGENKG